MFYFIFHRMNYYYLLLVMIIIVQNLKRNEDRKNHTFVD